MDDATRSPSAPSGGFFDRLTEKQAVWLVIAAGLLLYIPFAGTYGLWDPWETHYAEVARQMTKRGDFISLWWPGSPRDQDVFWSKPVLTYWLMSIAMHILGIGLPGGDPGEMAIGHRAEWAVRTPMCLTGVMGMVGVYLLVSRFVSRRAGLLSAIVLGTSPMYSLIARQAITDMPYVGPMTLALAFGVMAVYDDESKTFARTSAPWQDGGGALARVGRLLTWPRDKLFYAYVGSLALVCVPQLVIDSYQLKFELPFFGHPRVYGAIAMIPYYIAFLLALFLGARAKVRGPIYLCLAALLCGLATLAKTWAPGLALPTAIFVAFLIATGAWRTFWRRQMGFGLVAAIVVLIVVAVPWHHAMLIRHGPAFWNELFGDNNWRRMVLGRHGDRGTFEYFLRELGYSLLPWVAIAPAALAAVVMRPFKDARKQSIYALGAIWFVGAYALVSLSMTKFHHYVLPAVPGIAIVIGCFLDDLLERRNGRLAAVTALVGIPLLAVVLQDLVNAKDASEHFLWLFSYDYVHNPKGRPWPDQLDFRTPLIVFGALFAVGTTALLSRKLQRKATVGLVGAAVVFTWFLLDVFMRDVAPYWSQKQVIAAYYENRQSPDEPLVAYMMYWRGETFYSKNQIWEGPMEERTIFDQDGADERMKTWLEKHRGRRTFFIYERGRQGRVRDLLPADARASFKVLHEKNNKFSLAVAQL